MPDTFQTISANSKIIHGSIVKINFLTKLKTVISLFKPRIVLLLLISAIAGAILGAGGWPGGQSIILLIITGMFSSAGASAINQFLERDRDSRMKRTRRRALPSGSIKYPELVLALGIGMVIFSVALSAVFNPALAIAIGVGAIIYIGVYTIWLKPRSILNIVIGGAAGSMAVISGGAASHAWNSAGVLSLALLVFIWTPTHFWSLAMAYRNDYASAGFPMLPVKVSMKQAAMWVAIHTLTTGFVALMLGFDQSLGIFYFIPVAVITIQLIRLTILLIKTPDGKKAFNLFKFSNIYLALVQIIIIILPLFH